MGDWFLIQFETSPVDDKTLIRCVSYDDRGISDEVTSIILKASDAKKLRNVLENHIESIMYVNDFGYYARFSREVSGALRTLIRAAREGQTDVAKAVLSAILSEDWEQAVSYGLLL